MQVKKDIIIFYIDDDQDDLDYFSFVINDISDGGVELYTHKRADHLLHALENPPPRPQLVFVDLNMPGVNGFDILLKLRRSEKYRDLPVVIFSTATDEESIKKSRNLGASYYLPKSGDYEALKKSIEHILNIDWKHFDPATDNFLYRYN